MKRIQRTTWLLIVFLVLATATVALMILDRFQSSIEPRTSDGLHYMSYRGPGVNDAVAYTGRLDVDSEGCVTFQLFDSGTRYLAAFREGTEVTADGIVTITGRRFGFGDTVVVGREYDPSWETLGRDSLPTCEGEYDMFGMGFD